MKLQLYFALLFLSPFINSCTKEGGLTDSKKNRKGIKKTKIKKSKSKSAIKSYDKSESLNLKLLAKSSSQLEEFKNTKNDKFETLNLKLLAESSSQLEEFLNTEFDANQKDSEGKTLMQYARLGLTKAIEQPSKEELKNYIEVMTLLLNHTNYSPGPDNIANLNREISKFIFKSAHKNEHVICDNLLNIIDLIMKHPQFDINHKDKSGNSMLYYPSIVLASPYPEVRKYAEIILNKVLLTQDFDINLKNNYNNMPLIRMFFRFTKIPDNDTETINTYYRNIDKILDHKKLNPNQRNNDKGEKMTPLMIAVKLFFPETSSNIELDRKDKIYIKIINKMIFLNKTDVNTVDINGETVIYYVLNNSSLIESAKKEIIKKLLEKGASGDIKRKNHPIETAIELARRIGFSVMLNNGNRWPS